VKITAIETLRTAEFANVIWVRRPVPAEAAGVQYLRRLRLRALS
jgi:hypothetical protein